jgi:hypothetical protein
MTSAEDPRKGPTTAAAVADRLMEERRFADAIPAYEERLDADSTDLVALLKLGICHLLNRSENRFLKIYLQGKERFATLSDLPAETAALWRKYEGLAVKVTGGAMVLGSLAIGGTSPALAGSPDLQAGNSPAVSSPAPSDPSPCDCTEKPILPRPGWDSERPTTKYGGGAYRPPVTIKPPEEPITDGPPPTTHKYGAGAYPEEWRN